MSVMLWLYQWPSNRTPVYCLSYSSYTIEFFGNIFNVENAEVHTEHFIEVYNFYKIWNEKIPY